MSPTELTTEDLARAAGLPLDDLWRLASNAEAHYWPRRSKWVKGQWRPIDEPKPEFKAILKRIHDAIQSWKFHHRAAEGGIKGRSYLTGARRHCGSAFVVTRDVTKAFPSIKVGALEVCLQRRGFQREVAHLLTRLMTVHGQVPHGAPLSSDAINLFFYDVDWQIATTCKKTGARYHRNVDDLIVSVPAGTRSGFTAHKAGCMLDQAIAALGLKVNEKKRRNRGFQPSYQRQLVHNVVVNSRKGIAVPKEQRSEILSLATSYIRLARSVTPEMLHIMLKERHRATGWYHCCRQYDFSPKTCLQRAIADGDRILSDRMRRDGVSLSGNKWWDGVGGNGVDDLAVRWRNAIGTRKCDGRPVAPAS